MGTHPIFESDFDCLTDISGVMNFSRLARASSLIRQSKRWKGDALDPLHDPSLMEGFATPDLSPNQIAPPDKQLMRRTRAHFKAINQMILRERRELKTFRIEMEALGRVLALEEEINRKYDEEYRLVDTIVCSDSAILTEFGANRFVRDEAGLTKFMQDERILLLDDNFKIPENKNSAWTRFREKLLSDKIVAVGTRPHHQKTAAIREKIYEDNNIPLYLNNVRVISGG